MLFARTISGAGSWMQVAAASWWVLAQTGQALSIGILAALAVIPSIVGSPIGGALADRYSPAKLLALFSGLSAIPPILVGVLAFNSELTVPLLYVAVFLGSIPAGLANPLITKIMPMTVPRELQSAAVADSSMAFNLARLTGPLIGSVLVITVGVGTAFTVNGLSYVIMFLVVRFTKLPYEAEQVEAIKNHPKRRYRQGVKEGWSFKVARIAILGGAIYFAMIAPVQQLGRWFG
jgi:MFS family permease